MRIYGDRNSGNCFKVRLTCSLLNLGHEWIEIEILAGESRTAEYLEKNPSGQIPLLELDDGRMLSESNAIINYLANGSELLPSDPFTLAKVQQWQFFEQYSHEPYIAVARFIALYQGMPDDRIEEYHAKQQGGHRALAVMEQQLTQSDFLTGDQLTTADISLYAYTHVAHEGGFDLQTYPGILKWLTRISSYPGYIDMG